MACKKMTVVAAVVVVAIIVAAKDSMSQSPPPLPTEVPDDCKNELFPCGSFNATKPSWLCCEVLSKVLHDKLACLCTHVFVSINSKLNDTTVNHFKHCNIDGVTENLCMPDQDTGNSGPLWKDKTAAGKFTWIAVSTLLSFLFF